MAAEKPRAAVGTAKGMSISVSRNCLPRNFFRTMIQATGRPDQEVDEGDDAGDLNEARMASMMTAITSGVFRTWMLMAFQFGEGVGDNINGREDDEEQEEGDDEEVPIPCGALCR